MFGLRLPGLLHNLPSNKQLIGPNLIEQRLKAGPRTISCSTWRHWWSGIASAGKRQTSTFSLPRMAYFGKVEPARAAGEIGGIRLPVDPGELPRAEKCASRDGGASQNDPTKEEVMEKRKFFPRRIGVALALLGGALLVAGTPPVWGGPEKAAAGLPLSLTEPAPGLPLGSAPGVTLAETYGRLPLYFIENRGQVDRRVKLYAQTGGQSFWFTRDGVCCTFPEPTGPQGAQEKISRKTTLTEIRQPEPAKREGGRVKVVRLTPEGMSRNRTLIPLEPQEARVNYFKGRDPRQWHRDIPTYRAVLYREAYPGIDLKFYGSARQLEYDIIVKPGADPGQVRFRYTGISRLEITEAGDLSIKLPGGGEFLQKKPLVYQEIGGQRVAREAKFRIHRDTARQVFGFEVAAYDPRYPLVIDPLVLLYSTFLGGSLSESCFSIAVDASGCAYVVGDTYSDNFPLQNPYQDTYKGNIDTFVTKFSADGQSLVYSTFLGGSGRDLGKAIAVDASGHACVTGQTESSNFPVHNAYQPSPGGGYSDAFVTKLSPEGNSLVYSTYLGGNYHYDTGYGIAVDGSGAAYVTGSTESPNFPTKDPYQGTLTGGTDAFVSKFDAGGSLVFSTFLAGSKGSTAHGIAVDSAGSAYVTGTTSSDDFPRQNAYQNSYGGGGDAFVTKFSPDGQSLVYSTYLGGSLSEQGQCIAVDGSGSAYASGWTTSLDFPKVNAYQPQIGAPGYWDLYVTKFSPDGQSLVYSTYLGGDNNEYVDGSGLAVDNLGCAYVTGYTYSRNFPMKNPYQRSFLGVLDAFVTKFTPDGQSLVYSTYLGGEDQTFGQGIAADGNGFAYVTGHTDCGDFPVKKAYQGAPGGSFDAFVTKLALQDTSTTAVDWLLLLD